MISTLTYRSHATGALPVEGLEGLLAKAKVRNHGLGVTGMLLVSEDQFYQWLEGPPEGLAQVWDDIQKDPRHDQIELIDHHRHSMRLFGDWDMKFVSRDRRLSDPRDKAATQPSLPDALISQAADLALKGNVDALADGIEELLLMGHDFLALHGALVEPAARLLGDWWLEDRIGSIEITIALAYLQTAVRRIGAGQPDNIDAGNVGRRILIAPPPGEPHILGAALLGDLFRRSGWRVTSEFPTTIEALEACVRTHPFDALTLCLSDVFERVEQILPLTDAIRSARVASANSALIVLAGGRLFRTRPDLAEFIGADAVYISAEEAMTKALSHFAHPDRTKIAGVKRSSAARH